MGSSLPDTLMNDSVFHVATLGMYAGTAEANKARHMAEEQAKKALSKEQFRQWQIDNNISRVRTMFGVDPNGDIGADPGAFTEAAPNDVHLSREHREWRARKAAHEEKASEWGRLNAGNAEAKGNKAKLDGWLDDYSGAVLDANNTDLNDQFMATNTANRWALSDRGLLGGSVDAGAQRRQISEMVAGRQKAVMASRDARRNAQGSLNNQRLNLEQQVAAGTQLNPDFNAFQEQTQMGLDQVRSNIAPTAVGNTFTTLGQGAGAAIAQPGRSSRTPTTANVSGSSTGTITR